VLSAARSATGRFTENTGDVGKLRKTANGTVSGGAEKRAAAVQMFYPKLAQVGKRIIMNKLCYAKIGTPRMSSCKYPSHREGSAMEPSSHPPLSPASLIQAARAAHPAFKYAIVVAGLAAIVVVVSRLGASPATLIFGIVILIVLMVLFLVFAQATAVAKSHLALPAIVLIWSFLLLAIVVAFLLVTSAFFDVPLALKTAIMSTNPSEPTSRPKTAQDFYTRAIDKFNKQDYQAALTDFTQVITGGLESADAYYNRGVTYAALNNNKAALADFQKALALDPTHAMAYSNRGNVRYQLKDTQGALEDYNQALTFNPTYAKAYYNRGVTYAALNNNKAALADFQKAADLYQQQGKTSDYQEALNRIKELQR
jgi:Tfp pilus assembly protein PilF